MPAPSSPAPAHPSPSVGFALPGRLLVVVMFMIQFMALLGGLGIYVPLLHEQGVSTGVLVLGSLAGFAALQLVLGFLVKLVPVRCPPCGARSWFAGFGWWPFIYRFDCPSCGSQRRLEVGRRY